MKKIWLAIACVAVLTAVIGVAVYGSDDSDVSTGDGSGNVEVNVSSQQEGIWVSGTGSVYATPDIAVLSLGVEVQAETVALAMAGASEAMDSIMAALENAGIAEEDIQTQQFNVSEVSEWEVIYYDEDEGKEERILGYEVTNTVSVKVRDIEQTGDIIDAVVAAGGDHTRINSVGFTVDDPTPYYEEARAQAVEYAKVKAEQLAELTEVELGSATYISESSYYYSSPNYYRGDVAIEAVSAGGTSISAGELEITATVQIAYAIAD